MKKASKKRFQQLLDKFRLQQQYLRLSPDESKDPDIDVAEVVDEVAFAEATGAAAELQKLTALNQCPRRPDDARQTGSWLRPIVDDVTRSVPPQSRVNST
jgi:hypothetical protein